MHPQAGQCAKQIDLSNRSTIVILVQIRCPDAPAGNYQISSPKIDYVRSSSAAVAS